MSDISAGVASLGLEDQTTPGTFNLIGELKDPLPAVSLERAANDDSGAASDVERTRAGMKKIAPMTFKIRADNTNTQIAEIYTLLDSGEEANWEYKYATDGGTVETQTISAWVQKVESAPALKDGTHISLTLNINTQSKA